MGRFYFQLRAEDGKFHVANKSTCELLSPTEEGNVLTFEVSHRDAPTPARVLTAIPTSSTAWYSRVKMRPSYGI